MYTFCTVYSTWGGLGEGSTELGYELGGLYSEAGGGVGDPSCLEILPSDDARFVLTHNWKENNIKIK
jgi:hypothetical protein